MELTDRLKEYAKAYKAEPSGREVAGTVELLEEAAEHIEALNKETEKYRKKAEILRDAAGPLVDYLYSYGTPHDAIVVRMDAVEHFSGETVAAIDVRD